MKKNKWQSYDDSGDIKENTGKIPSWFSALFYASIVIAIIYGISYHFIFDWSQKKEYNEEVVQHDKAHPQIYVGLNQEKINPYRNNSMAIENGKKHFQGICAACHKQDATGLIGPSLVDNVWLHGNNDENVFKVIMEGVTFENTKQKPSKGPMPAHKNSLGAKKTLEIMAWLSSINANLKEKINGYCPTHSWWISSHQESD